MQPQVDKLEVILDEWKTQQRGLDRDADQLLDWLGTFDANGKCEAVQAATRIRELCERMQKHFDTEDEIVRMLVEARGKLTAEMNATQNHADRDHQHLISRLKSVITAIRGGTPGEPTWKEAVYEFGLIIDAFDQHEEEEEANLLSLAPRSLFATPPAEPL